MPKIINIHDARIRTVSVGIRALTISDKQVTLAVFRQLFDESLINADGSLAGLPWGIVNYHPDNCKNDDHRHVVWQKGDELRRAIVYTAPHFPPFECPEADLYVSGWVRDVAMGRVKGNIRPTDVHLEVSGVPMVGHHLPSAIDLIHLWSSEMYQEHVRRDARGGYLWAAKRKDQSYTYWNSDGSEGCLYLTDIANKAIDLLCKMVPPLKNISATLKLKADAEAARRARWQKSTGEIMSLPQLFVAV